MKGLLTRKSFSICLALAVVILMLLPAQGSAATRHEESSPNITWTGTWTNFSDTKYSGGATKYSNQAAATATFTFSGTGVTVLSALTGNRGIAKVYVDSAYKKDIDLYSATTQYQKEVYSISGLTSGQHVVKIEVTGTKTSSSSNSYIDVDAFIVGPPSPTNLSVTSPEEGGSLLIRWAGADKVQIWRSDSRYQPPEGLAKLEASGQEFLDKPLVGGVSYSYYLIAVDGTGEISSPTAKVSSVPLPPKPTSVSVENEGSGGKLVVNWANPSAGTFESIRIYRSTVIGSLGVPVSLEGLTGTTYIDSGLANGTTYYYTVRTVDLIGKESMNTDQYSGLPSVSRTRYEEDSASIVYSGTWKDYFDSRYSGGATKASNGTRATAAFTFTSTSVSWISSFANNRGIARVYLDDVYQASIDLFSANPIFKSKVYIKTGMTNTEHTLRVEVTGTKSASSSNTFVDVDAFDFDATPSAGIPAASATPVVAGATAGSGEIVGRVVNRAGQTIPGTAVRVNATVVPTNPGGEFRFTLVGSGVYTVNYDAPGYRGQTQVIEVKNGQSTRCPTVIMDPGITPSTQGEIYGRVVNPVHQPIAGAAVRINNAVLPTNAAGEFRFQLVNPGVYTVYYDAAGYAGQTQLLEVKAGMVTYPPMVILSGSLGEIYGRILDTATRRPIPGTAVRINSSVVPTNPGGEFRFTLVHPGTYKVYYDAPGYKGQVQENMAVFAGTTTICPTVLLSR
jgi:hypothetical protein